MTEINPYRENCEIIRNFFKKPITLLLAIIYSLYIFAELTSCAVVSALSEEGSLRITFNILYILPIIAFFLLYFHSRSKKPEVSLKVPLVLLKILSIIEIVLFSVAIIAALLFIAAYFVGDQNAELQFSNAANTLSEVFPLQDLSAAYKYSLKQLPTLILSLAFSISMFIMLGSFKKSMTTVYLQKRGSVFFAVTSIALALFCTLALINYSFSLGGYLMSAEPQVQFAPTISSTLILIAKTAITFIKYILFVVFGFMYNSYIKKLSHSFKESRSQQSNTLNSQTADTASPDAEPSTPPAPVNFDPKPVFDHQAGGPAPQVLPTTPQSNLFTPENPYAAKSNANSTSNTLKCSACGNECPSYSLFCNNCGTKL